MLGDRIRFILVPPIPSREDLTDRDRDMCPPARVDEQGTVKSEPITRGRENKNKNKTKTYLPHCIWFVTPYKKPFTFQNVAPIAAHALAQDADLFSFEFLGNKQL